MKVQDTLISLKVSKNLLAEIKTEALNQEITASALIRRAIKDYLKKIKNEAENS